MNKFSILLVLKKEKKRKKRKHDKTIKLSKQVSNKVLLDPSEWPKQKCSCRIKVQHTDTIYNTNRLGLLACTSSVKYSTNEIRAVWRIPVLIGGK